jgi:hypothetical protein
MGNFSRQTFDPAKGYVGVRLQQGVPLVDADWNELNDVGRHELYDGLGLALSNGIPNGQQFAFSFAVVVAFFSLPAHPNDFYVFPGRALINGRPLNRPLTEVADVIRYSTQPWSDPALAAEAGVDPIPPLTTPAADRTDLVYLDVWEREVDSTEDADLINAAIGVETCVRLKREIAIRVSEGASTPPPPPPGHHFMPLALLNRLAGQAQMATDQVRDIRPRIGPSGSQQVAIPPLFQPLNATTPNWQYVPFVFVVFTSLASKPANTTAAGVIPLVLPQGVRLTTVTLHGYTRSTLATRPDTPEITVYLWRTPYTAQIQEGSFSNLGEPLIAGTEDGFFRITHTGGGTQLRAFNRTITMNTVNGTNIIENNRFSYILAVSASSSDFEVFISGVTLNYQH